MKKTFILTAAIALAFGAVANAANPSTGGTLALTGEVDGSISLKIQNEGGITLASGLNTNAATATVPAVSYYGTADGSVGSGWTKGHDTSNITMSGDFQVQVDQANTGSTGYTLSAALQSSDSLTWTLNGTTVQNGSSAQLTATGTYGSPVNQTLEIKVPTSVGSSSTAISNTINFTATAN